MSKKPFDKFINKESGAKKKERIRQEKRKARAEKNAYFEEQKRLAWEKRKAGSSSQRSAISGQRSAVSDQHSAISIQSTANEKRPALKNQRSITEAVPKSQISNLPAGRQGQKSDSATAGSDNEMPLNKFIAWSGVCGRREAADLIKAGKVLVNGQVITEPPHRVSQQDNIRVNGKKIVLQKNLVYILLNKPKDYITTMDDPEGRKTVMDLVKKATSERVFPVGRLDRNTTGVMLLTNDGELAQRLTHPKYEVKKIYEVRVDQPVTKQQLDTIAGGLTLEDGFIQPDAVAYADSKDKSVIGIEIHSGRNRIVRRIFEHLGFKVKNLDRVMYGIFTKKNVDRGKWRFLTEKEIRLLKHLNTSFGNKKSSR
ncbi:MAG: rRNA pseudouridine synthase [Chitinophagaceae bacterium]|nr:rRNA pseudouridine synthase [Chitinophagaceae bacterium]